MTDIIHYTLCPACGSSAIKKVASVKDHSVTGESFDLWECSRCTIRFTQDVPAADVIGKYYQSAAYISHTNTRAGLVNKLYHLVRNHTLSQKQKLICKATGVQTGRLLDIGAGVGAFPAFMKKQGWTVTALEPDASTRETAKEAFDIDLEPAEKLFSLDHGSYDAITMWHVLEHVHDLHGYLKKIRLLLKPAGRLFIAVPNYTSYDATHYGSDWAAYDMPIHLYHFSPAAMKQLLEKHSLHLQLTSPMWFDSFYVSLLSEKYKTGKQQLLNGFINGLKSNLRAGKNHQRCSSLIYISKAGDRFTAS